jgi:hypothetical protein
MFAHLSKTHNTCKDANVRVVVEEIASCVSWHICIHVSLMIVVLGRLSCAFRVRHASGEHVATGIRLKVDIYPRS